MGRFLPAYSSLLGGIGRAERAVVVVLLATIVICIFSQVVSRYLFGQPLVWVEELSTYAFIWGTFLGASLGLKRGRHIKIQSFLHRLPPGAATALRVATDLAIGVFCVLLVVNGVKAMVIFEWRQRTIALPIELPRYLFYSTPLILGAASMALTVLHDLLLVLAGRATPRRGEEALPL
jgi:TRAP-type C4-dicarboxylate transport system permease small subunit